MMVVLLSSMPVGCIIGLHLQVLKNKQIDLANQQWLLYGVVCMVPIAAGCTGWIVGWTLWLSIISFIGIMSHFIWIIQKTRS
jgi:hypothetical protein